ncbi:glutamine amidotransferase [Fodinisporobacter ferrooxydans]|uniref:Lipid II isoglutaminyl synthase (glutamine-hydrolyzing) subunit GatD n=1 Tax=Fodinisporobacter ferrooxydans TaxID=2901836 RepID=A0ABY4CJM2_9BACL|nr:glutamine amidotransferase [Alicyclobacillaceae bacterium MYW30-H2]
MTRKLRIAHLFPDLLNLYADRGNILALANRAKWRNIDVQVTPIRLGESFSILEHDIVLLGGGSDREQAIIGRELKQYVPEFQQALENGMPILGICGGYQLLGKYYAAPTGEKIPGLGILEMATESGTTRLIGNVVIEDPKTGQTIVGFENHSGRTYHSYDPLGIVKVGHGNNGEDQREGVRCHNLIGTYIHGPLLPKNPYLTDEILSLALAYRGLDGELEPLPDDLEHLAHRTMVERLLQGSRSG